MRCRRSINPIPTALAACRRTGRRSLPGDPAIEESRPRKRPVHRLPGISTPRSPPDVTARQTRLVAASTIHTWQPVGRGGWRPGRATSASALRPDDPHRGRHARADDAVLAAIRTVSGGDFPAGLPARPRIRPVGAPIGVQLDLRRPILLDARPRAPTVTSIVRTGGGSRAARPPRFVGFGEFLQRSRQTRQQSGVGWRSPRPPLRLETRSWPPSPRSPRPALVAFSVPARRPAPPPGDSRAGCRFTGPGGRLPYSLSGRDPACSCARRLPAWPEGLTSRPGRRRIAFSPARSTSSLTRPRPAEQVDRSCQQRAWPTLADLHVEPIDRPETRKASWSATPASRPETTADRPPRRDFDRLDRRPPPPLPPPPPSDRRAPTPAWTPAARTAARAGPEPRSKSAAINRREPGRCSSGAGSPARHPVRARRPRSSLSYHPRLANPDCLAGQSQRRTDCTAT